MHKIVIREFLSVRDERDTLPSNNIAPQGICHNILLTFIIRFITKHTENDASEVRIL